MQKWKCNICGWIYDPAIGAKGQGVEPGVLWEDVSDDFRCPCCGAMKKWFQPVD